MFIRLSTDVGIKSCQNFSKSGQKSVTAVFTQKVMFFNYPKYFCNLFNKICHQELSKIVEFGHTGVQIKLVSFCPWWRLQVKTEETLCRIGSTQRQRDFPNFELWSKVVSGSNTRTHCIPEIFKLGCFDQSLILLWISKTT